MYLGKVIGNVVATTKEASLQGKKLLVVTRLNEQMESVGTSEIAIDIVGAGNGEVVLVTKGSSARNASGDKGTSADSAIIAIIDSVEIEK